MVPMAHPMKKWHLLHMRKVAIFTIMYTQHSYPVGVACLILVLSFCLPLFVNASSECSGETAHLRWLD